MGYFGHDKSEVQLKEETLVSLSSELDSLYLMGKISNTEVKYV